LRVNNIADKEYSGSGAAASVFDPTPMTVESFYPAPERNYWLQFSYRTE
jgi:outer membrane receptor protein involved in Fe transport